MADFLAALGAAAAVAQFIDYGFKLVNFSHELYKSTEGRLESHNERNLIAEDMKCICDELSSARQQTCVMPHSQDVDALRTLAEHSSVLAHEFLQSIARLQVKGKYRGMQAVWRALKAIWQEDKLNDFRTRLSELRSELTLRLLSMFNSGQQELHQRLDLLPSMRDEVDAIRRELELSRLQLPRDIEQRLKRIMHTAQQPLAYSNILRSLVYERIVARESAIPDAFKDTYEWALDDGFSAANDLYLVKWLRSQSHIYWVTGLPGSGKSTLMRFLYEHSRTHELLAEWASNKQLLTARHFFWAGGTEIQKSQEGLLRSLLHGILSQRPDIIPDIVAKNRWSQQLRGIDAGAPWTLNEMKTALLSISQQAHNSYRMCLFIDGVDEYAGNLFEIADLLKALCTSDVKLLIASREWNVFTDAFGQQPERVLHLHDLTRYDIETVVRSSFQELQVFAKFTRLEDSDVDNLVDRVLQRAHGVFLWVSLVLDSLQRGFSDGDTHSDLISRIDEMPEELNNMIDRIFSSIDTRYYPTLRLLLDLYDHFTVYYMPLLTLYSLKDGSATRLDTEVFQQECSLDELRSCFDRARRHFIASTKGLFTEINPFHEEEDPDTALWFLFSQGEITHRSVLDYFNSANVKRRLMDGGQETSPTDLSILCRRANLATLQKMNSVSLDSHSLERFARSCISEMQLLDEPETSHAAFVEVFVTSLEQKLRVMVSKRELVLSLYPLTPETWDTDQILEHSGRLGGYYIELMLDRANDKHVCKLVESREINVIEWRGRYNGPLLQWALIYKSMRLVETILLHGGMPRTFRLITFIPSPGSAPGSFEMWHALCETFEIASADELSALLFSPGRWTLEQYFEHISALLQSGEQRFSDSVLKPMNISEPDTLLTRMRRAGLRDEQVPMVCPEVEAEDQDNSTEENENVVGSLQDSDMELEALLVMNRAFHGGRSVGWLI